MYSTLWVFVNYLLRLQTSQCFTKSSLARISTGQLISCENLAGLRGNSQGSSRTICETLSLRVGQRLWQACRTVEHPYECPMRTILLLFSCRMHWQSSAALAWISFSRNRLISSRLGRPVRRVSLRCCTAPTLNLRPARCMSKVEQ